jgi:hypothetical protein
VEKSKKGKGVLFVFMFAVLFFWGRGAQLSQVSLTPVSFYDMGGKANLIVLVHKEEKAFETSREVDLYSFMEKIKLRLSGKEIRTQKIPLFHFVIEEVITNHGEKVFKKGQKLAVVQPSELEWTRVERMETMEGMRPSFIQESYRPDDPDNRFGKAPEKIILFLQIPHTPLIQGLEVYPLIVENAWELVEKRSLLKK